MKKGQIVKVTALSLIAVTAICTIAFLTGAWFVHDKMSGWCESFIDTASDPKRSAFLVNKSVEWTSNSDYVLSLFGSDRLRFLEVSEQELDRALGESLFVNEIPGLQLTMESFDGRIGQNDSSSGVDVVEVLAGRNRMWIVVSQLYSVDEVMAKSKGLREQTIAERVGERILVFCE